jgi:hypothetical protein
VGTTVTIEKTSFKAWQKQYGRSIGLRAPGLFVAHLTRIVAKTGGTLTEVPASKTKLSQYCHQCRQYHKKPRSQRWHQCPCGCGPVQRDLYSAFAAFLPGTTANTPLHHPARLGRCGAAPESRAGGSPTTCERGALLAPKHGRSGSTRKRSCPCRSASARKSCLSPSRADFFFGRDRKRWVSNRNPRALRPGRSQMGRKTWKHRARRRGPGCACL